MISPETLHQYLHEQTVIPYKFGEQRFLIDAAGALVWPKYDLIVFSDLHLEKGSFLSQFANPIPRFDSKDTIERMQALITKYKCKHIICLGDSFHDQNALSRMEDSELTTLNKLVKTCDDWLWVLGNHDPDIPNSVLGRREPYRIIEQIMFSHEPEILDHGPAKFQVVGHYHPKMSYRLNRRKVKGKVFLSNAEILLMPAFGAYTGGLDVQDPALEFMSYKGDKRAQTTSFFMYNKRIYML